MNKQFIFVLLAIVAMISGANAVGSNRFAASGFLSNLDYGPFATFDIDVWFQNEGDNQRLRVDYKNANGVVFMRESYNYVTNDRYQICPGSPCKRATFTNEVPAFFTNAAASPPCTNDGYNGQETCTGITTCYNPGNNNDIFELQFNGNQLCKVLWKKPSGGNRNVYHINSYTANADAANNANTYTGFIPNNCPEPVCFTKIDFAFIIDESGSISASEWTQQINFLKNIVNAFQIDGDDGVKIGVGYFSGTSGGSCRTNVGINPASGIKATILAELNDHTKAGGFTCGTGGVEVGTLILKNSKRTGVPRSMIFLTDGVFNRRASGLQTAVNSFYAESTTNEPMTAVCVGVDGYVESQLLIITQDDATKIYAVDQFSQLQTLLTQLTQDFCEPLESNPCSCNGLCTCESVCTCPSCGSDSTNVCRQFTCGNTGVCQESALPCNDGDACTVDTCVPASGCLYTAKSAPGSIANNFCIEPKCTNGVFSENIVGNTKCGTRTGCIFDNCDPIVGKCEVFDRTLITAGTTITYTDLRGVSRQTTGCAAPDNAKTCEEYTCSNGQCDYSRQNCECVTNAECNQGGCSVRVCDNTGTCQTNSTVDCLAEVSMDGCTKDSSALSTENQKSIDIFYGINAHATFFQQTGNVPSIQNRNCNDMACFAGQRSTFTCQSQGPTSHVCIRSAEQCISNQCTVDRLCRPTGQKAVDANGETQISSECYNHLTVDCSDNDECTINESCNRRNGINQSLDSTNTRCQSDARVCTNSDGCFTVACNSTTGCVLTPKPLKDTTCTIETCSAGSFTTNLKTDVCTDSADACIVTYCNETANVACQQINRKEIAFGEVQSYTDALGVDHTVTACRKNGTNDCIEYTCLPDGGCARNYTGCDCTYNPNVSADVNNLQCNDNDGCTEDVCNEDSLCVYTFADCYSDLSNGSCIQGGTFGPITTANQVQFVTTNNVITVFGETNGQPTTGIPRTCSDLACFKNERSTYKCKSLTDSTYTCERTGSLCTSDGCVDNICTPTGVWTNTNQNDVTIQQAQTSCDRRNIVCPADADFSCDFNNRCNATASPKDGAARCIKDTVNCVTTDKCKKDICLGDGRCDNSPIDRPSSVDPDTYCFQYQCNSTTGNFDKVDRSFDFCPPSSDKCVASRCTNDATNVLDGSCVVKTATDFPFNSNNDITDSSGNAPVVIRGCEKPSGAIPCITYTCNSTTGECDVDTSACVCQTDSDCDDGNGCTIDTCDFANNACVRTPRDCHKILSNNVCDISQPIANTNEPSLTIYNNGGVPTTIANGLNGVDNGSIPITDRTCADLACYMGEESLYTCVSEGSNDFKCKREVKNTCTTEGCVDRLCTVVGGNNPILFSDPPQIDTTCEEQNFACVDADLCTVDNVCNNNWTLALPTTERCIFDLVDCDDNDKCTEDFCDSTDTQGDAGDNTFLCRNIPYSSEKLVELDICPSATCADVTCENNECKNTTLVCPNGNNCLFFACNGTNINETIYANTNISQVAAAAAINPLCLPFFDGLTGVIDECGICGGDGSACQPVDKSEPITSSVALAAGITGGIAAAGAAAAIAFGMKKGYDQYQAIANEGSGAVSNNIAYQANAAGNNPGIFQGDM